MCELIHCSYHNLDVHEELVTQAFVQRLLPDHCREHIHALCPNAFKQVECYHHCFTGPAYIRHSKCGG